MLLLSAIKVKTDVMMPMVNIFISVSFDLKENWILPDYRDEALQKYEPNNNAPHHRVKHNTSQSCSCICITERDVADDIIDNDDEGTRVWAGEGVAVEQWLRQPQSLGGGAGPVSWPGGLHTTGDCDDACFWIYWSYTFGHRVTFVRSYNIF